VYPRAYDDINDERNFYLREKGVIIMSDVHLAPTPWKPDPTPIPQEWMDLIDNLERRTIGMQHEYVLGVRLDARSVGELLRSWGLPLEVVLAGFLQEYDRAFLLTHSLPGMNKVVDHINEANRNKNYIDDENLPPLLTPPYKDLGAVLVAVATYYQALRTIQQQSSDKPAKPGRAMPQRIERTGNSLLNVVKRLGMWYFKRDVEDVTEQLRNPVPFDEDQRDYDRILKKDETVLEETRRFLETTCRAMTGLPVTVIYEKCGVSGLKRRLQDAHTTVTSLKSKSILTSLDLVTFDVVMPTVQDCYIAFAALSQLGHIQDRLTDHIANPKQNGYSQIALGLILDPQSPHARKNAIPVEPARVCQLQIATNTMQAITNYGCLYPACYQRYSKEYYNHFVKDDVAIEGFWQSSEGNVFRVIEQSVLEEIPARDTKAPIVVFDKKRTSVVLPVNATVLDFAYALDSEIGNRAVEAIVNNRKAPLYRSLQTGDIVEIRTSRQTQADYFWLEEGYVRTPKAKRIIKEVISRKNLERRGYELIRDKLRRYHFALPLTEFDEQLRLLLKRFQLGTRQEFLERLEKEDETEFTPDWAAQEIMKQVAEENTRSAAQGTVVWVPVIDTSFMHYISGTYRQRVCGLCRPTHPRDTTIVGRLRKGGRELVVHRETCSHLIDRNPGQLSKPIPMTWQMQSPYRVAFYVKVQDREGLVLDLVRQLRRHKCYLRGIQAEASSPRADIGFIFFTIEVYSDREVLDIWNAIEKIENFNEVQIDRAATPGSIADRLEKLHEQGITRMSKTIIEFDWEELVGMLPVRAPVLMNPFNISRPAGGNMFFGRSEEIKIMQRELCDAREGRALVMYGPRRSGKSSLCKQFIERYMHAPSWGVLYSLQNARKQTEAAVLMQLAERVGEVFHENFQTAAPTWDDFQDNDPQTRFKRFLRKCIEQVPDSRLILVLDEFGGVVDSAERHILGYRFFTFWKELLNSIPQLSLLFALPTSSHHTLSAKSLAHTFSFAQPMAMTFLDSESARRLLSDPLRDLHIAIHPNTMARAVMLTGGNPYYLTLIGQQLISHLNRDVQKQVVSDNDLNQVIEKIIADRTSQNFDFLKSELVYDEELLLLEKMIDLLTGSALQEVQLKKIAFRAGMAAPVARRYLDRLCMGLILSQSGPPSNPIYSFKIELVRRWLIHNRSFFAV
jgi:(p)ppGpp synthase/HD superfamily hydrolase